jgi:anti-anti-sigma regulatory factor
MQEERFKETHMDNLKLDDLEIVITNGDPTIIKWLGISQSRKPEVTLNPFFEELAQSLGNVAVIVDFTELEYMNSSTVSPIIMLCKKFNEKGIATTIRYSGTSDWQAATFKGLSTLAKVMKNIQVEAVNPQ